MTQNVISIDKEDTILVGLAALVNGRGFLIDAPGARLIGCAVLAGDGNGFTFHGGGGGELINCKAFKCAGSGVQGDKGHKGITVRGGEFSLNVNDGCGGESGTWTIAGSHIHDNGGNVDSRDGIQITDPEWFEIAYNFITNHHNANVIIRPGKASYGQVYHNTLEQARHGCALEGEWSARLDIRYNKFIKNENGIFGYGRKPKKIDGWIKEWREINDFSGNQYDITENWGKP